MATQLCTGFAAGALLLSRPAMGHMGQTVPMSRQVSWSVLNGKTIFDLPEFEGIPHYFNSGGLGAVRRRGNQNIDPEVLEAHGGAGAYPLHHVPLAENGNMVESNEIAKRHFVCGDPRGETSAIKYSTPNEQWDPLTTYASGQIIEMEVRVQIYHKGHVEFSICDGADVNSGDVPTQECFNKYPLTRAADDDDNSPIDPNFPGRFYVPPPCTAYENGQGINENVDFDNGDDYTTYNVKARYQLPDITCTHCVLQMHYFAGHHTKYVGYNEFNPPSWPSACAPDKEAWNVYNGAKEEAYPEEFWHCSDIAIEPGYVPESSDSPDEDEECGEFGGIYHNDDEDGEVCCAAHCMYCLSTTECHYRNGGAFDCCPSYVSDHAGRCSETNPAPCNL